MNGDGKIKSRDLLTCIALLWILHLSGRPKDASTSRDLREVASNHAKVRTQLRLGSNEAASLSTTMRKVRVVIV